MKKHFMIISVLIAVFLFTGCGKKAEIVASELAEALAGEVVFSEQLTQIDNGNIEKRYSLNTKDYNEIIAYVGTASVCDEYLIVKTESPQSMTEKISKYIEKKKEIYEKYRPDEVYKLDNAVIEEYNNAVVMIIAADTEKALDVYKEYLKK